jgi:hypothetical protein
MVLDMIIENVLMLISCSVICVCHDLQAVCGDTVSVTVTVQREIDEEDSEEEKGETTVGKVICPRYGLEKTEAYWLVIGDSNSNALLSIKRISIGEKPSKVSSTDIHTPSLPFRLCLSFLSSACHLSSAYLLPRTLLFPL